MSEPGLLRSILNASPDYVLAIDGERRVVYVNHVGPEVEENHVVGLAVEELVPPYKRAEALEVVRRTLDEGVPGEWRSRGGQPQDEDRLYHVRVSPIEGLEHARAVVQVADITDAENTRRALVASEERVQLAMTRGQIGFWELDVQSMSGTMSSSLRSALGLSESAITPKDIVERTHPDDRPAALKVLARIREDPPETFEREYRLRTADGTYRTFIDRAVLSNGESNQPVFTGTMVDVTALRAVEDRERQLRAQLEQAQRLESIGLLAGGIAHDFNNLLTIIIGGVDLALGVAEAGEDPSEDLNHVLTAAQRAAELTGQLLAYSRRTSLQLETVDMAEVARDVTTMCERLLPATISLSQRYQGQPTRVQADRQQLGQALLNLVINARDAMPDGGTIELAVLGGPDVTVAVADSGVGIAPAARDRMFEPFFTTKEVGQGTGLGLAMVHGIVQQHGGEIDVDTEVGRGTTITLRFPPAEPQSDEAPRANPTTRAAPQGRILVAEDEPQVLRLVTRMLESAGFEVVAAGDGAEAVAVFTANRDIDLLLFDAVMPRLDGWRAYEAIRKLDANVPVLFSTGYTSDALPGEAKVPLISKPYRRSELLRAVAEALAQE